jgi:pyruvate/2-oxoglutarate dehydrogenase complex dihydrolipoamide dehydrogenase (E3) component
VAAGRIARVRLRRFASGVDVVGMNDDVSAGDDDPVIKEIIRRLSAKTSQSHACAKTRQTTQEKISAWFHNERPREFDILVFAATADEFNSDISVHFWQVNNDSSFNAQWD